MRKRRNRILRVFGVLTLGVVVIMVSHACSLDEPAVYAERGEGKQNGDGESEAPTILAVVGGIEITEAEIAGLMESQLLQIRRQRQQILEQGLERVVSEKLLELEAARRGVSVDTLLSEEVEAKVTPPTAEEIDTFYEERKAQIRQPKEQVVDQIRDFLIQQRRTETSSRLVEALKEKHGFESRLEPFRVRVETDGFPAKGPSDAPVTIVEFSDFECPYCSRINPTLARIFGDYGDEVRIVFRQFPLLNIHASAQKAAEASLCAHDQDRFWEMHDAMFKEQRSLGVEQLKEKAARLGLDTEAFNDCLDSSRHAEAVTADLEAGSRLGVSGTPALFINGRFLSGAKPYEELSEIIEEELGFLKSGS